MSEPVEELPGVLPRPAGDLPRYLVLSAAAALSVAAWEDLGRPCWSCRWLCPVELPGGESRPEYLYARTAIPCYQQPQVAACPPFEAVGAELGYDTPRGELWVPVTVVECRTLSEARFLVRDIREQGGRYITWDRSLSERTHQLYLTDGDETSLRETPVYPQQSPEAASREDGQPDCPIPAGPRRKPTPATDTALIGPPPVTPKRRSTRRRKAG